MNQQNTQSSNSLWSQIHWVNAIFLIACPMVVFAYLPFDFFYRGVDHRMLALFFFSWGATSLSITAGYHRLFSHRSYDANKFLQFLYLLVGAAAFQGSALKWGSDHRRHHKYVDHQEDPYAITKGFWFAHIGWLFLKEPEGYENAFAADLKTNKLVAWQHKYYIPIAIVVGFGLPTLIGWIFFDHAIAGLLYGGFARILVSHHTTFFINSLCHMWGRRPYSLKTTARDNFVLAILTCGEGYHNFHHRFEADYRNGIRWYHWDPTKWLIKFTALLNLSRNLRKIPESEILKAKLCVQESILVQKGLYDERIQALRAKVEDAHRQFVRLKKSYAEMRVELKARGEFSLAQGRAKLQQFQIEVEAAKIEFQAALGMWNLYFA